MQNDVLSYLLAARLSIDDAIAAAQLDQTTRVRRGDNLPSMVEMSLSGSSLRLDADVVVDGDYDIVKPIRLLSDIPRTGRVNESLVGPTLRGAWQLRAPGVLLNGLRLEGRIREQTILTAGPASIIDSCALVGSALGQHRGILANSSDVQVLRSSVTNIWADIETQAIAAWRGCKNLLVDDCTLEAAGIAFMLGGDRTSDDADQPADIFLKNSLLTKQPGYKSMPGVVVKNLLELKSCRRVMVRGCLLANSWRQSQDGFGIVLNVRNQYGDMPWATVEDILITDCDVNNVQAGVNILGSDNNHASQTMRGVTLDNIRFNEINGGRCILIGRGPRDLTIRNTSWRSAVAPNSIMTFDDPTMPSQNLVVTGNRFLEGWYGLKSDDAIGAAVLDRYAPGYTWADNSVKRGPSGSYYRYPAGTTLE